MANGVKDGKEIAPHRYQTMTNEETYKSFKENCSKEVGEIMVKHSEEMALVYGRRRDSPHKEYRMNYIQAILPKEFPSMSCWLDQRPSEVKPMHDHIT